MINAILWKCQGKKILRKLLGFHCSGEGSAKTQSGHNLEFFTALENKLTDENKKNNIN